MPLKRLELCDFKSYRGEQVIDFGSSHFTCIIGPNGSGKSNLMDAISFVLGVKSAQLRSTQLKDLIYRGRKAAEPIEDAGVDENGDQIQAQQVAENGAKKGKGKGKAGPKGGKGKARLGKRKNREDDSEASEEEEEEDEDEEEEEEEPRGENDAHSAWVMAVYADKNDKEFRYKRSINAAGASSYSLNGKAVTYLLYNQSLEKHNILVKAKNFLVFQGDVEAVASQKPSDLAKLIDQISGSLDLAVQYNQAKAAWDKAVETATQNYSKKRGVAGELKQYKEQKSEVERWESMQEQKDALIVEHMLWRLFHIEDDIGAAREKIVDAQEKLEDLESAQTTEADNVNEAKQQQAKANLALKKQEGLVKKAEKVLEEKRPGLVKIETQIEHAKKKIATSTKLVTEIRKDETRMKEAVAKLKRDLQDAQAAVDQATANQREAAKKQGVSLNPADIKEYQKLKAESSRQAVDERQQLDSLKRKERPLRDARDAADDAVEKERTKRDRLAQELEQLQIREESVAEKVKQLETERNNVKKELDKMTKEKTRIGQLETEINEKLQDAYNKLINAKAHRMESDKESKLKDTIVQLKKHFPGVHGRVVDLCKPTQQKYNTAVQVILGKNLDSIVVDHEKTAIDCIEYLRTQRTGQATFIPLDTIQIHPINDKLRSVAKGARLAIDVIQFDPTVERALQHACGSSLVCDSDAIAKSICYDKGIEVKAVTLEGTVIHRSGLITGGQGSTQGRKFDAREVAALEKTQSGLMEQLGELSKQKPRQDVGNQLSADIGRIQSSLAIVKDDQVAIRLRLTGAKDELKHTEKDLKSLESKLEKAEKAYRDHQAKVKALAATVDRADDTIFSVFCKRIKVSNIREYEDVQLRASQQESEAVSKYQAQIARLNSLLNFEEVQLKDTQKRISDLNSAIQKDTAAVGGQLETSKEALNSEIKACERKLEEQQQRLETLQNEHEEATKAVELARKAHSKAAKALDSLQKDIAGWTDEMEQKSSERFSIYRRCKLEEIELPLKAGSLDKVPIEENLGADPMEVDDEDGAPVPLDYGIEVDYDELPEEQQENGNVEAGLEYEKKLATLTSEIEKLTPNMKAIEKLDDMEAKMKATDQETKTAKETSAAAKAAFDELKKKRCDLFNKAFNHISERIDPVYKDLTKGKASPLGGVAYLSLEDSDEPYLSGIKYHAMPPMKRFRDMEQLSGGEKTMAALALLFAIHRDSSYILINNRGIALMKTYANSYQPSPFFVLDEVDAALDNTNVGRIAEYIRTHASATFQFIVISLKGSLYERSNSLVGIYRDQDVNSSRSLTLDLQKYDE